MELLPWWNMAEIDIFYQKLAGRQLLWKRNTKLREPRVGPLWVCHLQILVAFLALQTVFGAKIHVFQGIV